jgi:excisionase family DNA binding protein
MSTTSPDDFLSAASRHEEGAQVLDRLLTVAEVMTRLRLSRSKVYDLIRSRQLPSGKAGRARRIPESAVTAYIRRLVETEA